MIDFSSLNHSYLNHEEVNTLVLPMPVFYYYYYYLYVVIIKVPNPQYHFIYGKYSWIIIHYVIYLNFYLSYFCMFVFALVAFTNGLIHSHIYFYYFSIKHKKIE